MRDFQARNFLIQATSWDWGPVRMRPYSNDLRDRVVVAMEAGGSCRDVGAHYGIAPSTAGHWHRRYRQTKSYAPLVIGGDRRWKLAQEVG